MFAQVIRSGKRQFVATIVPSADQNAAVWGVLYRIPRHVTVRSGSLPSLLDAAHSAGSPDSLFRPISVVVRETYREREITCGTYALAENARRQFSLLSLAQVDHSLSLVQQLAAIARKQKFPEQYLKLSLLPVPSYQENARREQNTEPIPALKEGDAASVAIATARELSSPPSRLLNMLAIYLILLLLLVLVFAVLQGMGFVGPAMPSGLLVLGVPWLVLVYGLLGACMSSLISLAHSRQVKRPLFVMILWFGRPFLGIVLAALAYQFFNSGLFVITELAARHTTVLPLLGGLAGLAEGWLFRQRARGAG
jgi:hypothetical protein